MSQENEVESARQLKGKGFCLQVWKPELNPQNPQSGRKQSAPAS